MSKTLLGGRLELHDVQDSEAFCGRLLTSHLGRTRGHLLPSDREDALAYLLAEAWELSRRWAPDRGIAFSTYAHRILKLRIVDWYRRRFSDQRFGGDARRQIDFPLSLDAPASGECDSLAETLAARPDDRQVDSEADLGGLFGDGGGELAWRAEVERHRLAARSS